MKNQTCSNLTECKSLGFKMFKEIGEQFLLSAPDFGVNKKFFICKTKPYIYLNPKIREKNEITYTTVSGSVQYKTFGKKKFKEIEECIKLF